MSVARDFVTGAGFTQAFLPDSPLMVDDFGAERLAAKVKGLPMASRLLDWERSRHREGFINVERLMTRLDSLMPYDEGHDAVGEYRLLKSGLMAGLLVRLKQARAKDRTMNSRNLHVCAWRTGSIALPSTMTIS